MENPKFLSNETTYFGDDSFMHDLSAAGSLVEFSEDSSLPASIDNWRSSVDSLGAIRASIDSPCWHSYSTLGRTLCGLEGPVLTATEASLPLLRSRLLARADLPGLERFLPLDSRLMERAEGGTSFRVAGGTIGRHFEPGDGHRCCL